MEKSETPKDPERGRPPEFYEELGRHVTLVTAERLLHVVRSPYGRAPTSVSLRLVSEPVPDELRGIGIFVRRPQDYQRRRLQNCHGRNWLTTMSYWRGDRDYDSYDARPMTETVAERVADYLEARRGEVEQQPENPAAIRQFVHELLSEAKP